LNFPKLSKIKQTEPAAAIGQTGVEKTPYVLLYIKQFGLTSLKSHLFL